MTGSAPSALIVLLRVVLLISTSTSNAEEVASSIVIVPQTCSGQEEDGSGSSCNTNNDPQDDIHLIDTSTKILNDVNTPQDDDITITTNEGGSQQQPSQCKLYMAESAIPNAGWGMYTGIDVREGDEIGYPEMAVLMPDYSKLRPHFWLVDDVFWDESYFMRHVHESNTIPGFFYPGFGALINCHKGLLNVDHRHEGISLTDTTGLHRSRDPGVGAFTPHHNHITVAEVDILAGSELFVDYGNGWFREREEEMGVIIPFEEDFEKADEIVRQFRDKVLLSGEKTTTTSNDEESSSSSFPPTTTTIDALQDAWDLTRNQTTKKIQTALPSSVTDVDHVADIGTARHSLPDFIRQLSWLQQNGLCVDNLYAATSTIPQAGRGAFATRFITEGNIIAPSPVLQLDRQYLDMKEVYYIKHGKRGLKAGRSYGKQLLFNYVYGHTNSSVVLLPYSPMVNFINHDGLEPNAILRWSSHPLHQKSDWLDLSKEEVLNKTFGLLMEVVALRDIKQDEEVTIDYGKEWQDAWDTHVSTWEPTVGSEDYISATEYTTTTRNDDGKKDVVEIRTIEEQKTNPFPENLRTACAYDMKKGGRYHDIDGVSIRVLPGGMKEIHLKYNARHTTPLCIRPCTILSKVVRTFDADYSHKENTGGTTTNNNATSTGTAKKKKMVTKTVVFTAEMENSSDGDCDIPPKERHIVSNIPPSAFTLVDKPYTVDQYLVNAFRHEIGLPDGVFPSSWMDLKDGKNVDEVKQKKKKPFHNSSWKVVRTKEEEEIANRRVQLIYDEQQRLKKKALEDQEQDDEAQAHQEEQEEMNNIEKKEAQQ